MSDSEEIKICGNCDGRGFKEKFQTRRELYGKKERCPRCEGSGRVMIKVVTTVTPYYGKKFDE